MPVYGVRFQEGGIDYEWVETFAASLLLLLKAARLSIENPPLPHSQPTELLQSLAIDHSLERISKYF